MIIAAGIAFFLLGFIAGWVAARDSGEW